MNSYKEIGGYFAITHYGAEPYHKNAAYLNSGRNALRYIIRANKVTELFVPYYTCPVVLDAIKAENCNIQCYDINRDFTPIEEFPKDAFILCNNYFGVCEKNIAKLSAVYPHLIIDNAQSFYSPLKGIASFYSPRKFFGLPDGGIVVTAKKLEQQQFEKDVSFTRMSHLLKRQDLGASAAYADFKHNDTALDNQPIKEMSELTTLLMGNINYNVVKTKRLENFYYLHNILLAINELHISLSKDDVPMVYPLLTKNNRLRELLIENKIYAAKYWDGIISGLHSNTDYFVENLIPLPIDQRYNLHDMARIIEVIHAGN
ncbi:hypothetical protein FACS189494_04280 [Spirochaetia bacterium]|nr:hypothetical protein FACS189494_04280 [Spirochaetia bacterium]